MKIAEPFLHSLFPEKCLLCTCLLSSDEITLCRKCAADTPDASRLKRKIPFLSGSVSLWYYEKDVRKSLLRFKFWHWRSYARGYGALLATKLPEAGRQYDLITWVPVSRWRKLKRGFDQVEVIAMTYCKNLQVTPVRCLKKIRHTPPQSLIASPAQRRANVLGAYKVTDRNLVAGKRILLLDDIITTGATISECAKTLKMAGAQEVYGMAIATARPHKTNQ